MAESNVPNEIQIFPYGLVQLHGGDPFTVDDPAMNRVIQAFQSRGLDLVIDYEHQTEGGQYSSPTGQAPAAGWVKKLINRGTQGLWAAVEWTERAKSHLAAREYRYYSPVYLISKKNQSLLELLRVALTNAPRLNAIRPIVAKIRPDDLQRCHIAKLPGLQIDNVPAECPDETQRHINRLLGVSDATWSKYGSQSAPGKSAAETQSNINKLLGISGEVWAKYNP